MKRYLILIALVILAAAATSVWAAPTASYEITWYTIDGSGGTLSAGAYTLAGTVGQPDAGTLIGSSYTLAGGYWSGTATLYRVYLPLVLK